MPTHNGPGKRRERCDDGKDQISKSADQVGTAGIEINVLIISGLTCLCDQCLCGNKITKCDNIAYKCQRKRFDKHGKRRDSHTEDTYL